MLNRAVRVLLTAAALASIGLGAAAQARDDVETLSEIEQRLARAWVSRDRATIDAILAPEWSVTDASGRVLTKHQVLAESFDNADRRVDAMTIDDVRVRVFGDAAVVTGRTRATGSYRGSSATVVLRFTDTFVRRDGRWQAVASHGSLANEP
jgi:ketosteroid isomerase-like protein